MFLILAALGLKGFCIVFNSHRPRLNSYILGYYTLCKRLLALIYYCIYTYKLILKL